MTESQRKDWIIPGIVSCQGYSLSPNSLKIILSLFDSSVWLTRAFLYPVLSNIKSRNITFFFQTQRFCFYCSLATLFLFGGTWGIFMIFVAVKIILKIRFQKVSPERQIEFDMKFHYKETVTCDDTGYWKLKWSEGKLTPTRMRLCFPWMTQKTQYI